LISRDRQNRQLEFTVGQVAKRSGLAVSAIHFYEKKGLIWSNRNSGNQRQYPREILRRVSLIKVAQELGISLSEIKTAFNALPLGQSVTIADWKELAKNWKVSLSDRISRLERLRNNIDKCIGCGCLSLHSCPLRNSGDRLAEGAQGHVCCKEALANVAGVDHQVSVCRSFRTFLSNRCWDLLKSAQ
jgi:MerR family transcriptional regulator, redox-sensitive transcriptional activator SoxR